MTTEQTIISYGLRGKDGRIIRLERRSNEGEDACGEYSYSLTTQKFSDTLSFRVESAHALVVAMRESTPWYNSSPDRPGWGNVKIDQLIPVKFTTRHAYDELGGDPVSTHRTMETVLLPKYASSAAWSTIHRDIEVLTALFGGITNHIAEDNYAGVAIIDTSVEMPEIGDLILTNQKSTGQLWSLIDKPAGWKFDRGHFIDFSPAHYKLGLMSNDFRDAGDPVFELALHPNHSETIWECIGEVFAEDTSETPTHLIWKVGDVFQITTGNAPRGSAGYYSLEAMLKLKNIAMHQFVEGTPASNFTR